MSNSPSNKRKIKLKYDVVTPGLYFDGFVTKIASNKRRVSSQDKLQISIIENYENKVHNIFEKQLLETEKQQNKLKSQKDQLSQKELIEKLVNQMQDDMRQKEKELFETNNTEDQKRLERRKSIFYQELSQLAMLEKMKERFSSQQQQKKQVERKKNKHQSDISPMRETKKQINIQCQQYEQEQIEHGLQEYYKIQRIKRNVEKQLNRLGLIDSSINYDQRLHSQKQSILQNASQLNNIILQEKSKSKSNPKIHNTNNILKKIKEKIQHIHTNYSNNSMNTLITCCDQEIAQLKKIDYDINKRKRIQIKKYRVIQKDLDAIGFMKFQRTQQQ